MTDPLLPSKPFQPRDLDFRERVKASFARQNAMHSLGISLFQVEPGQVELRMPFSEKLTQQHGFIHAGIITTALDSACGYAAYSLMPKGDAVLTVEFKTNLLAPARGDEFAFRARVTKPGRTLSVCDGYAFALSENEEKLVASMTGTMMAVSGRDDVNEGG